MLRDVKRMTSRRIPTGSDRYIASNKYTWAEQFRSRTPVRPARKVRFARDKIINRFREGASLGITTLT